MDSPVMAEFAANLDRINALADRSPGFIWRLQTEEGNATAIRPFADENLLMNMSVWRDLQSLSEYVYRSAHAKIMRRRREWFERMSEGYLVLWWVPVGHRPGIEEAIARLERLRAHGPTPGGVYLPTRVPCAGRRAWGEVPWDRRRGVPGRPRRVARGSSGRARPVRYPGNRLKERGVGGVH